MYISIINITSQSSVNIFFTCQIVLLKNLIYYNVFYLGYFISRKMYAFLLIYIINTYTCSSFKINRSKSDTRRNSTWSPSTPKPPLGRTGWRTYLSWVWRGLGSGSRVCRAGAPLIPTPPCSTLCLTQGPRLSIYWLMADQTRWAGHRVMFDITCNLFGILLFCND